MLPNDGNAVTLLVGSDFFAAVNGLVNGDGSATQRDNAIFSSATIDTSADDVAVLNTY
jgi:hypothetical protein